MEFVCRNCNTSSSSLRRCTGCYIVYYCSKTCQMEDWRSRHSKHCKGLIPPTNKTSENGSKQHQQGRSTNEASGDIKLENKPRTEPERGSKQQDKPCFVCKKVKHTKACSRCKTIQYCSEECQAKDWIRHRQTCIGEFDGHIKTKGFLELEQLEKMEKEKSDCRFNFSNIANSRDKAFQPFEDLFTPFCDVDQLLRSKAVNDKAKELAQIFHPCQRIINDLDHIETERFGIRPTESDDVLVGLISRFHDTERYCVYIQDKNEQEIYVAFDFDNPLPFFVWGDLKPGRGMSIQDPYRHYFGDGSVGIRIEVARNVKIFNVG